MISGPHGTVAPAFAGVRDEFVRNFTTRGDIGAALCVIVDGEVVVDLWGGHADPDTHREWTAHTPVMVWSATKGATALCAHLLADRGIFGLDEPLVRCWPEFGGDGREPITLAMVLSHRSGLPHLRQRLPAGAYLDPEAMAARLTTEKPFWEPGSAHGYHAASYGWMIGEVVRRTTGKTLGRFFADEITTPLRLDFWIGLPPDRVAEVAPCLRAPAPAPGDPIPPNMELVARDPESIPGLIFRNTGKFFAMSNEPAAMTAEIPAINGIATARGLAGIYAPVAAGGGGLFSAGAVARMGVERSAGLDESLRIPSRFALGFQKTWDNRSLPEPMRHSLMMSDDAFGHVGFGGSTGFADPTARLAFGYVLNRHGTSIVADDRGQALIDAVYSALGYRGSDTGPWTDPRSSRTGAGGFVS